MTITGNNETFLVLPKWTKRSTQNVTEFEKVPMHVDTASGVLLRRKRVFRIESHVYWYEIEESNAGPYPPLPAPPPPSTSGLLSKDHQGTF